MCEIVFKPFRQHMKSVSTHLLSPLFLLKVQFYNPNTGTPSKATQGLTDRVCVFAKAQH